MAVLLTLLQKQYRSLEISTNERGIDQLLLRADSVPKPFWGRSRTRPEGHYSRLAVWTIQLVGCRPAMRTVNKRLRTRQIWLQTHYGSIHGLDGSGDFHPILFTVIRRPVLRRSYVWHSVGCIPGMFLTYQTEHVTTVLIQDSCHRLCRQYMLLKLCRWC